MPVAAAFLCQLRMQALDLSESLAGTLELSSQAFILLPYQVIRS